MLTVSAGRKATQKILKETGIRFVEGFISKDVNAISLRCREPGTVYKIGGLIGFAVISEYSGPNSMEDNSPTLMRLRVNTRPPTAVSYHLNSPAVKYKLGIKHEITIAERPALEVTGLPEEIGLLGGWLVDWLDGQFHRQQTAPAPPIKLVERGWDMEGRDVQTDLMATDDMWLDCEYLWTEKAITLFDPWVSA